MVLDLSEQLVFFYTNNWTTAYRGLVSLGFPSIKLSHLWTKSTFCPTFEFVRKFDRINKLKLEFVSTRKPFVLKIRLYSPLLHLHLFSSLDTVDRGYFKILQMTWFEPRISGVGSDRYTNWATTTARETICHNYVLLGSFWKQSSLHIIDSIGSSNREHSF